MEQKIIKTRPVYSYWVIYLGDDYKELAENLNNLGQQGYSIKLSSDYRIILERCDGIKEVSS